MIDRAVKSGMTQLLKAKFGGKIPFAKGKDDVCGTQMVCAYDGCDCDDNPNTKCLLKKGHGGIHYDELHLWWV